MAEMKLIPGFRFHPTDVELILYFLKRKVLRKKIPFDVIAEVDIYKYPPWDLPAHSLLKNGDLEWYFFCPRGKKYASGARMNRATEGGYWKTTGKDRSIEHKKLVVGMIKTLVFHTGKAPKGDRTDWVMHEFRLEDKNLSDKGIPQDSYVICKVFQKDGPGPRNGAQYGKPFNEEDWDEEEEIGGVESIPDAQSVPIPIQPTTCDSSVVNDRHPSTSEDYFLGMVDYSKDDDTTALNESTVIEEADNPAHANNGDPNNGEVAPYFDPDEIFVDLGDLDSMVVLGEDGHGHGDRNGEYTPNDMLITADDNLWLSDSHDFLELDDLEAPLFWQNQQDDPECD